eukprot:2078708-Amphidinium_carterae.1
MTQLLCQDLQWTSYQLQQLNMTVLAELVHVKIRQQKSLCQREIDAIRTRSYELPYSSKLTHTIATRRECTNHVIHIRLSSLEESSLDGATVVIEGATGDI